MRVTSHMAIINAPEEMLDNSMKRRFLARVGVEYCVRDVVFWRHQRVAATIRFDRLQVRNYYYGCLDPNRGCKKSSAYVGEMNLAHSVCLLARYIHS